MRLSLVLSTTKHSCWGHQELSWKNLLKDFPVILWRATVWYRPLTTFGAVKTQKFCPDFYWKKKASYCGPLLHWFFVLLWIFTAVKGGCTTKLSVRFFPNIKYNDGWPLKPPSLPLKNSTERFCRHTVAVPLSGTDPLLICGTTKTRPFFPRPTERKNPHTVALYFIDFLFYLGFSLQSKVVVASAGGAKLLPWDFDIQKSHFLSVCPSARRSLDFKTECGTWLFDRLIAWIIGFHCWKNSYFHDNHIAFSKTLHLRQRILFHKWTSAKLRLPEKKFLGCLRGSPLLYNTTFNSRFILDNSNVSSQVLRSLFVRKRMFQCLAISGVIDARRAWSSSSTPKISSHHNDWPTVISVGAYSRWEAPFWPCTCAYSLEKGLCVGSETVAKPALWSSRKIVVHLARFPARFHPQGVWRSK